MTKGANQINLGDKLKFSQPGIGEERDVFLVLWLDDAIEVLVKRIKPTNQPQARLLLQVRDLEMWEEAA